MDENGRETLANAGHYVLGSAGLGILRRWLSGDREALARQVEELVSVASAPEAAPLSIDFVVEQLDVQAGYARWSENYDTAPNPLIRVEQPVVQRRIDARPKGIALDAACGTGRHAAYLAERGHRVIGVDTSSEMLARAAQRVPGGSFRPGGLEALPVDTESVDLAVCALALTHLSELGPALRELSRVLRAGGRLIVSDLHPVMTLLGGTALFLGVDGRARNVHSYHHPIGRYLAAFEESGLRVVNCDEPAIEREDLAALSGGLQGFAERSFHAAWVGLPNALIWQLERL